MSLFESLRLDSFANRSNPKGRFIAKSYRIANYLYKKKQNSFMFKVIAFPFISLYRSLFYWLLCVEIPETASIGAGLQVWHGFGLVINPGTVIGSNVLLRHNTTIGNKYDGSPCPVIGNNVHIGAHTIIIGDVVIGDNVIIGAGSVVTKSVPPNSVAYGNPLVITLKNDRH